MAASSESLANWGWFCSFWSGHPNHSCIFAPSPKSIALHVRTPHVHSLAAPAPCKWCKVHHPAIKAGDTVGSSWAQRHPALGCNWRCVHVCTLCTLIISNPFRSLNSTGMKAPSSSKFLLTESAAFFTVLEVRITRVRPTKLWMQLGSFNGRLTSQTSQTAKQRYLVSFTAAPFVWLFAVFEETLQGNGCGPHGDWKSPQILGMVRSNSDCWAPSIVYVFQYWHPNLSYPYWSATSTSFARCSNVAIQKSKSKPNTPLKNGSPTKARLTFILPAWPRRLTAPDRHRSQAAPCT